MRKALMITCIGLLSSCSLFKASEKKKNESNSLEQSGSTKVVTDVDSSHSNVTRRWKLTFAPTPQNNSSLPSYRPPMLFPDLGTGDLKSAMKSLQKSYNELAGKKAPDTNMYFNNGHQLATLEMEELMNIQNAKFRTDSHRDTSSYKKQDTSKENKKEPINPWLVFGCVVVALLLIYFLTRALFHR